MVYGLEFIFIVIYISRAKKREDDREYSTW